MSTSSTNCDFYDCDPDETALSFRDVDDAVAEFLDASDPSCWPETVAVYGWDRQRYEFDPFMILEGALERADEEHGDPDEPTSPSAAMVAAARAFAGVLDREYVVWACDRRKEPVETVVIRAWVRSERPAWIENSPGVREYMEKEPR